MNQSARKEDMSQRGQLVVFQDNEGDIHVAVYEDDGTGSGDVNIGSSVEFTTVGFGGGKSPNTRKALLQLIAAMKKDNEASPERKGDLIRC